MKPLGFSILAFVATYVFLKAIATVEREFAFLFWAFIVALGVFLIS